MVMLVAAGLCLRCSGLFSVYSLGKYFSVRVLYVYMCVHLDVKLN